MPENPHPARGHLYPLQDLKGQLVPRVWEAHGDLHTMECGEVGLASLWSEPFIGKEDCKAAKKLFQEGEGSGDIINSA